MTTNQAKRYVNMMFVCLFFCSLPGIDISNVWANLSLWINVVQIYCLWYNSMKLLLVCMFGCYSMEKIIQLIALLLHINIIYCKLSQPPIIFMLPYACRIDITKITMKECSAYGEVGCDGGYDRDQREEPRVYEIPHAQWSVNQLVT